MHTILLIVLFASLATATSHTQAQFVRGNDAVKVMGNGTKRVEMAPLPTTGPIRTAKPCLAKDGCHAGSWHMVETAAGLLECTEAYARPGTCRASTYGAAKLSRLWVVKTGGEWLQCQYPDLGSKCVKLFARPPANLPFDAIQ